MAAPTAWRWHHNGYAVTDLDEAIAFHRDALGYEVVFEARGLADQIAQITGVPGLRCSLAQLRRPGNDHVLELLDFADVPDDADPALPIRPGRAHTAFLVDSLHPAIEQLSSVGGALCGSVTTFSEGQGVYMRTPVGTVVELLEPNAGWMDQETTT